MKKIILILLISSCLLLSACLVAREEDTSQVDSESQPVSESQPEVATAVNVFIDYYEKSYSSTGVVEIPMFATEDGNGSGETERINDYLKTEVNDYVQQLRQVDEDEYQGVGGLSVMTYPITSERYIQLITLSRLNAEPDNSGKITSVSYSIDEDKFLSLEDAYTIEETTEEELLKQVNELTDNIEGTDFVGEPTVAGFTLITDAELYVEFFIYLKENDGVNEREYIYSFIPRDPTADSATLTKLDSSALLPVDRIDTTEEPLRRHYDYELHVSTAQQLLQSSVELSEDYSFFVEGEVVLNGTMCVQIAANSNDNENLMFAVGMFGAIYEYTQPEEGEPFWSEYSPDTV